MKIDIVSVFPEYFDVLNLSLFGKAQEKGLVTVTAHNLRDWTHDVHHSVDDTPAGGGAGMVMKPEVWAECLDDLLGLAPAVIRTRYLPTRTTMIRPPSVRPAQSTRRKQPIRPMRPTRAMQVIRPTQPLPSLPSFPIPRATPVKLAGTPRRFSSSRIPRRRCSRSATRPSSRTPTICCSAAADTRAMTRESLSITARRASTYANTRSATTC